MDKQHNHADHQQNMDQAAGDVECQPCKEPNTKEEEAQ
jgi:hypothetical protein